MRRSHRSRPARTSVLAPAAVALAVAVVAATAMWGRENEGDDRPFEDPGVAHVHGLGVDPADASLIVATHFGLFRLPAEGGGAERIGTSFQDTMGFTVAGPGHLLGSGHPDADGFRKGQPARLGLIESKDGGETWTSVSLRGRADFHALAQAGERVYGWDSTSGELMVTTDRRHWEKRSTVSIASMAVDPRDAEHLVATTAEGLIESRDGARTWAALAGPALGVLSWDAGTGLFGVASRGAVWRMQAGGQWVKAGSVRGEPQALLATGDAIYLAAADAAGDTGVYRSVDEGRTWKLHYQDRK